MRRGEEKTLLLLLLPLLLNPKPLAPPITTPIMHSSSLLVRPQHLLPGASAELANSAPLCIICGVKIDRAPVSKGDVSCFYPATSTSSAKDFIVIITTTSYSCYHLASNHHSHHH